MAFETAIEGRKPELLAIFALGAQIKPGEPQPVRHLQLLFAPVPGHWREPFNKELWND